MLDLGATKINDTFHGSSDKQSFLGIKIKFTYSNPYNKQCHTFANRNNDRKILLSEARVETFDLQHLKKF